MLVVVTSFFMGGGSLFGAQERDLPESLSVSVEDDLDLRRAAEEERLSRIRSEIEELRVLLLDAESRAGTILDDLDELDLRLALLEREAASLAAEIRRTRRAESMARLEADRLRAHLASSEENLRGWLLEVYKAGPIRYLRLLVASSSPAEIAAAQRAIEVLSREESWRVEELRATRARLEAAILEIEETGRTLARLADEMARRESEVRRTREEKTLLLRRLRARQTARQEMLRELVQVETEIQNLLRTLQGPDEDDVAPSRGIVRFRGLLNWPVVGRLLMPFGNVRHPRFKTEVPHPGIDIEAPPGTEVRSVYDGTVVFSNWFRGYGNMIVIDHGGGFLSIYGHLGERLTEAGQEVDENETIARAGESGPLDTPGVYFELRYHGKPEDPLPWLRRDPEAQRGLRTAAGPRGEE